MLVCILAQHIQFNSYIIIATLHITISHLHKGKTGSSEIITWILKDEENKTRIVTILPSKYFLLESHLHITTVLPNNYHQLNFCSYFHNPSYTYLQYMNIFLIFLVVYIY